MSVNPLPQLTEPPTVLAAAEERKRLARELHDSLGYTLTISIVQLENALELVNEAPQQAHALIEAVRSRLTAGQDELRLTLTTLRNHEIPAAGLLPSLWKLTGEFAAATGIAVTANLPEMLPSLSDAQATAVYRSAQEALINAFKHGRAQNICVNLYTDGGALVLRVKDDGRGLAPPSAGGFGLLGMKDRAGRLGGALQVNGSPEGGVAVTLSLPLEGEVHA